MSKKVVIGIIIVIVLALVLYWVYKANQSIAPQSPTTESQNTLNQNQQVPTTASVQPQTTPENDLQTLDNLDKEYDSSFNQEIQNMDTEINKL